VRNVKCVDLRRGDGDALFFFGGAGGEADELAPLVSALRCTRPAVVVLPFETDGERRPQTIDSMAAAAVEIIKSRQPQGPYWMVGYSFGGLLAFEAGRRLRESGEEVRLLGLIDAIYDRRYWPLGTYLTAIARRTGRHMSGLIRRPPSEAFHEFRTRAGRLWRRLRSRMGAPSKDFQRSGLDRESANFAAMADWRPCPIGGSVVLLTAGGREEFGCDPAGLWRRWAKDLEVRKVPGNHLDIIRDPQAVGTLARTLDSAIESAKPALLRALLATNFRWPEPGRLAAELADAGWVVEAVAPAGSILHSMAAVKASTRLSLFRPLSSLREAVTRSHGAFIIPFDDRMRSALQELYYRTETTTTSGLRLRELLARSLGRPEFYPVVYSRAAIMAMAAAGQMRSAKTSQVNTLGDAIAWIERNGPSVLKTDGSWGGRGVVIAHDARDAAVAWDRLSRPPNAARIFKRFVVERDPWPLRIRIRGLRPAISIQTYVPGRPGNVAAACLRGELLGAVQAEVVRSDGPLGPSTVLRIIDHPDMLETARTMARRLGISGLCGFDFILEEETGRASFIELNIRATPTCHLVSADGVDLLASLRAALGYGKSRGRINNYPGGLVALFPQEMKRDPSSPYLSEAFHDVPDHAREFVARAAAHAWSLQLPGRARVETEVVALHPSRLDG
jgi:thioesterase domain-containing protein